MSPLISVVVCTYNRAPQLEDCLSSLEGQQVADDLFEVLVVDNNSTDQTRECIARFEEARGVFRYLQEHRQGLSHARNAGWENAQGRYVAYIDDDAKASSDWVGEMLSFIDRNPSVEAFGGPYSAYTTVQAPAWFPPEYGSWSLGDQERALKADDEYVNGTNMVFRKQTLISLGGFNPALGMKGEKVLYGEETQLQVLLRRQGGIVYYAPRMKVAHLIAPYKFHLRWLLRSTFLNGLRSRTVLREERSLWAHLSGLAIGSAKFVGWLPQMLTVPFKRWCYYALQGLVWELGALFGMVSATSETPPEESTNQGG